MSGYGGANSRGWRAKQPLTDTFESIFVCPASCSLRTVASVPSEEMLMCVMAPPRRGRKAGLDDDTAPPAPPMLPVLPLPWLPWPPTPTRQTRSTPSKPPERRKPPGAHSSAVTPLACQCIGARRRTPAGAGIATRPPRLLRPLLLLLLLRPPLEATIDDDDADAEAAAAAAAAANVP